MAPPQNPEHCVQIGMDLPCLLIITDDTIHLEAHASRRTIHIWER
jgi:hypothetical protein